MTERRPQPSSVIKMIMIIIITEMRRFERYLSRVNPLDFICPPTALTTHYCAGPGLYPVKNTEVGNGATALHAAVENGHAECVAALLERGAAQLPSMEGATPLVIGEL